LAFSSFTHWAVGPFGDEPVDDEPRRGGFVVAVERVLEERHGRQTAATTAATAAAPAPTKARRESRRRGEPGSVEAE
jgi:hypothetical protein